MSADHNQLPVVCRVTCYESPSTTFLGLFFAVKVLHLEKGGVADKDQDCWLFYEEEGGEVGGVLVDGAAAA